MFELRPYNRKNNSVSYNPFRDMEEFEKTQAALKLLAELAKGEKSAREEGYTEFAEVERLFGGAHG